MSSNVTIEVTSHKDKVSVVRQRAILFGAELIHIFISTLSETFQANGMLTQVVLTSSLWTSLYCFVCYFWRSKSYEWSCRSVSLLHALLITSLSYYCTFIQGPWPFTDAGGPNTPFQESIAIISVGYFIFDFFWCLYFQTDGQTMLCHHFVSIIALAICLITGSYGTEIVATIFGSEISNPLLQCRWFLKYSGNRDTAIADLVDAAFILTFTYSWECLRYHLDGKIL
ncbi:domain-containing 5-like [Octopus vulgaris]|uniref:Domain-containing 5-like n=1 Tax=Octopus vulgaris TaxID=6645 RepID=A0AA36F4A8_OCTVU|nr:domain-containing 5-like [Octopus vulgaris]